MRIRDEIYSKEERMSIRQRMKECGIDTWEYHKNHSMLHESLLIFQDYVKSECDCKTFAANISIPYPTVLQRVKTARIALRWMLKDISDDVILQLNFLMKAFDCNRSLAKLIYENIGGE